MLSISLLHKLYEVDLYRHRLKMQEYVILGHRVYSFGEICWERYIAIGNGA